MTRNQFFALFLWCFLFGGWVGLLAAAHMPEETKSESRAGTNVGVYP